MSENPDQILLYGADWCGDCRRAKNFFDDHQVAYVYIHVEGEPEKLAYIRQFHPEGIAAIPTIIFPDGGILIEPTNEELARKLGISSAPEH